MPLQLNPNIALRYIILLDSHIHFISQLQRMLPYAINQMPVGLIDVQVLSNPIP